MGPRVVDGGRQVAGEGESLMQLHPKLAEGAADRPLPGTDA